MRQKTLSFLKPIFGIGDVSNNNQISNAKLGFKLKNRNLKIVLFSPFLFILFFLAYLGVVAFEIYKSGNNLYKSANLLLDSFRNQDLSNVKQNLLTAKNYLLDLELAYNKIKWFDKLPFLGNYFDDFGHIINASKHVFDGLEVIVDSIDPNLFELDKSVNGSNSANLNDNKSGLLVKIFPSIADNSNQLIEKIGLIDNEISYLNPLDYPEKIGNFSLRKKMNDYISTFRVLNMFASQAKPLIEVSPYLLGFESKRNYMIIFQNDKELRPTGGFITAYTLAKVENGNFEPILSSDIYDLDDNYTPTIKAPDPIIKYIKGPYTLLPNLRLRDMNWSPDFEESMKTFADEAKKAGITNIDGIIAIDTEALLKIVEAIGSVYVPGYGEYTSQIISECNCPQIIYELESFASVEGPVVWSENDPGKVVFAPENYDDRKKIIGPLMNALMHNAFNLPLEKTPLLLKAIIDSLVEKHILFYVFDSVSQNAIELAGIGGRIEDFQGDYLHINDANLGGRKSNLYVTQEVDQKISILKNNEIEKIVTITYKNPEKYDGWLNSILPNWLRIYVPEGSELVSAEGFWEKVEPYNELGKTVFAGYFELRPQGITKITLRYKLPFVLEGDFYKLKIQKQPGKKPFLYRVKIGSISEEFDLNTDKKFSYKI
ncbi:MAG: DUF4012 domain-containing protein [Patescibacteria group bacterium]|nr:DUF4012 domain-containing protein [Patescibacteria group bacterium]